jgi:hypothetical protein
VKHWQSLTKDVREGVQERLHGWNSTESAIEYLKGEMRKLGETGFEL